MNMKQIEIILDTIKELSSLISLKYYDLDCIDAKKDDLQKEIYILEFKKEIYSKYLDYLKGENQNGSN